MYRFTNRNHPDDDVPHLFKPGNGNDPKIQNRIMQQLKNDDFREAIAEQHRTGNVDNPRVFPRAETPFVSMTKNHEAASRSTDPWLMKIATGLGPHQTAQRAPDIGEFQIPRSRLIFAPKSNTLSTNEQEVLFYPAHPADNIRNYPHSWIKNPH